MDFEILPQLIIVLSIAGILAIVGKNFSKIKEAQQEEIFLQESEKEKSEKEKFLYLYKRAVQRINKENYQKKMAGFWVWLEKFLRKIRIVFLKLDGKIVSILEHLRKKNIDSIEKLKETERTFRKNMENENFSKFWNAKRAELKSKHSGYETGKEAGLAEDGNSMETEIMTEVMEPIFKPEEIVETEIVTIESENAKEAPYQIMEEENVVREMEETVEVENEMEEPDATVIEEKPEKIKRDKVEGEEEKKVRTKKEQEYIEILMKNPADIKAYWKLGLIYSKRRNYEDSLACFRQIVKIDPTYTKAKQKAIELMEKMKGKGK